MFARGALITRSLACRLVAEKLGVCPDQLEVQLLGRSRGLSPELAARHGRFASAVMLGQLLEEADVTDVEEAWAGSGLMKPGAKIERVVAERQRAQLPAAGNAV